MKYTDMLVILNPAAGRGRARRQQAALCHLLNYVALQVGCSWQIVETTRQGEAATLARQAAHDGIPVVVAAGGDGTLGEVANGLVGTPAKLGILPLGTGNDFARCVGISENLSVAVDNLFTGKAHPVDLGRVGDRYFINVAGCGFDAAVAQRVNRGFRFLHGTAAYVAAVYQTLMTFKPMQMHITVDDEVISERTMLCTVANSQSYGGGMRIAPMAQIDDGWLDVCIVKAVSKVEFVRVFPRVFTGIHITHPCFVMLKARRIQVESNPPVPVLVDGDVQGTTPIEFTVHPSALQVILPAK
ncbi:MAG: diacylglycerol kinase family lipid kinase [Chthonomonadetes bacterium]|nr:diacylglycerol kinase family lipid kinase [Chthonomonadetes bacterium]